MGAPLLLAILAVPALWAQSARTSVARTNVVLIVADDFGYECVGANGGTSYETPNIDRLAREGMRFTHAYSQPRCTPSRVKLMTGKYNWRNYKRFGYLEQGERTFAHLMKEAGYATGMTGKWQLWGGPAKENYPSGTKPGEAGFDEHMYFAKVNDLSAEELRHYRSVGLPRSGQTSRYWHPAVLKNGKYLPTSIDEYGPEMFADFAIDFIKRNRDGPFFLYYPMTLAHAPWVPTPNNNGLTNKAKFKGSSGGFADSVAYADHLVGRLVEVLDDLEIGDNTLVLFTADNGTSRYVESRMGQRVVRGGKGETTDAGTHVPLIARWTGTVRGGAVSGDLIDFSDFYTTLADLTGQRPSGDVDGRSFLRQLRGQVPNPREWLVMHHDRSDLVRNPGVRRLPERFARTKRYKLYSDGQFFDVPNDRGEQAPLTSLTAAETAIRSMLQGALDSMPPTAPGVPTDLRAEPGPGHIKLSWKAPANTGGTPITGYKIEVSRKPDRGGWRTLVANTGSAKTTYRHFGLERYASRRYRVQAVNSVASSVASKVASATAAGLPALTLSLEPSSVGEGARLTTVTVTASLGSTSRSEPTQVSVSVIPQSGTATAGTDYEAVSGFTVTIPAGQASGSTRLRFRPTNDGIAEGDETVVLSGTATGLATGTATLTILDDDGALPVISVQDSAGGEGSGKITFTVKLAPASSGEVTVDYATSGGTATQGTDYTAASGTLRFAPGDTEKNIEVTVADDGADENDETFEVTLDKATNAGIADGSARGMITDNDGKPNVLFISIDDLNDWIEPLGGHAQAKTPNLTRLAKRSTLFSRAYGAAPVCNPSRVALLTGIAPYRSGVLANATRFRTVMPDVVTLPHAFRKSGYWAGGLGKIFHHPDDGASWDAPRSSFGRKRNRPPDPRKRFFWKDRVYEQSENNIEWGPLRNDRTETSDGTVVKWVSDQLGNPHEKPFFLGVGIYQPHPPWFVPKKYFDRFPLETVKLPSVKSDDLADLPSGGVKTARRRKDHEKITSNGQWRNAVQAYLAALNFADEMLGLVLDALEESGRADNTIVVLWGDHGWHHGQKEHWRKHALWEQATHTPLMIYAPRGTPGLPEGTQAGTVSYRPVSLLDLYPTMLELAGLERRGELDGSSLIPLLRDPARPWHPAIMTHADRNGIQHAARSDHYRYIRYSDGGEEFYDHQEDPLEWNNLASDPKYREEKEQLAAYLRRMTAPGRLEVNPETLTIAEGSSGTYTVALPKKPNGNVTVAVGGASGDVTVQPSSLSFTELNWETEQTVTVTAAVDPDVAADPPTTLTHSLTYRGQEGVARGPDVVVTVTESKQLARALSVQFSAAAYTAAEGGTAAEVTVGLSADPDRTVTVPLTHTPVNGAEAADYSGVPASVTFSRGQTSQTFTVSATDDGEDDDGEAVALGFGLLPTGVTGGAQSTAAVNLVDDDVTPVLSVSPAAESAAEGERVAFVVTLSATGTQEVTVAYATADGTAKAGEDYTPASGTLVFRPGQTAKTVAVATIQDKSEEEDETFTLELGAATNAKVRPGRRSATATIRDDDQAEAGQQGSPAGIALWTDELGYLDGEQLRLFRAMDPNGDQSDYTLFFYRESIETGERRYMTPATRSVTLREEAVDQHGRGAGDFWAGPVEPSEQELIWEGAVPAPGLWHFVAELRGPDAATVVKRAHAKFVVARRSEALNGAGIERAVADELRLRSDTLYSLRGRLAVKAGATLRVEAGTLVRARGARAEIVVEPGGRIEVQGRQEAPAVMTCAAPVGRREPGCWGGLRVLGRAPAVAGPGAALPETFGGSDPHDSSGTLRYLRVEFAGGGPAGAAIALHGVGDGTRIEQVQAHASLGDGIAFRGGTAECAYCVASEARQDGLDWAHGWQGTARHVYVQQGPEGGSGMRASGSGAGPAEAVPTFSNVTLVGVHGAERRPGRMPERAHSGRPAIRLEAGAALATRNALVVGFEGPAIEARSGAVAHFVVGRSRFTHAILHANRPFRNPRAQVTDGISAYVEYLDDDPDLLNVRYEANPDPRPAYGSAALRPAGEEAPPDGFGLSSAPRYVGAFGGWNWLQEWTFFGAERDYEPAVESGHR